MIRKIILFAAPCLAAAGALCTSVPDSPAVAAGTGSASAHDVDAVAVKSLKSSAPVRFMIPAAPDSLDGGMNAFRPKDLLNNIKPDAAETFSRLTADWTTLTPDTAGVFRLPVGGDYEDAGYSGVDNGNVSVIRAAASVRPSAYFSGKVRLRTPLAAVLYLDGKKVAENLTSDSTARDIDAQISLRPYQDAVIEAHMLASKDDKGDPTVSLSLIPDEKSKGVEITVNPEKRHYSLAATVSGPRVSKVNISPDGRYMIVTTSETSDGKNVTYSYDIRRCDNGEVTSPNFGEGYGWMPGKPSVLYCTSERADGCLDIRTVDYPSMRTETLAVSVPAEAKDFEFSPTGDYIVYTERVKDERKKGVMNRVTCPDDRIPGNADRFYLNMVSLSDGVIRPLTRGGSSTYLADISPKGDKLLYISSRETPSEYPFYVLSLVELDVRTLKTDTICRNQPSLSTACYSSDARRVFITAGPSFAGGTGVNAGEHPIANDFDIQGYVMNLSDRKIIPLTKDFDPSISGKPVWNYADGNVYFMANTGFDNYVYSLNPDNGKIKKVSDNIDYVRNFSVGSRESRWLAYTGMSYTYMGRACIMDLKSGRSRVVADPMSQLIADTDWGEYDMWNFTAPDGTVIEGYRALPPDFSPSKKYPLIVYYYGGTTPSNRTNHSPYSPTVFASQGYVVYVINPSGTIGYGQEFSARHVNAWGDRTADEIIMGTKKFCEEHPFVDSSKIGCIGASYGGFMTQLLVSRTDIFAAAVSHAGISNVTSYWGEGFWGYSYNAVAAAKSYPWSDPDIYTQNSALFNADKIHTPLLLLHGSVDTNVPIGESIQLYNALKVLGREVEFVTVDGENHIIMDFQKRKEWHNTIMAWFEKWLKGDSRWWDSIYK